MRTQVWMGSLLALGLLACGGPKGYVIQGEVTGFPDSTEIYFTHSYSEHGFDTIKVVEGRFRMEGTFPEEPAYVYLRTKVNQQMKMMSLLMGNEQVEISGDLSEFPLRMNVSGSKYHQQWEEYARQTLPYELQRDSLIDHYVILQRTDPKGEDIQKIREQFTLLERKIDSTQRAYLFMHPDTYPSLIYLQNHVLDYSQDTVRMLFDRVSPKLQSSSLAKFIRTYLDSKLLSIGDPFGDFEAEDQNGNPVRLSDFVGKEGKYLLLDFTLMGCMPCRMAEKEMLPMVEAYSDSLRIVSFWLGSSRATWLKSPQKDSLYWTNLWSPGLADPGEVMIPYQLRGFPTFFVIDPQGVIVQKWSGYRTGIFEEQIGRLKNQPKQ